MFLCCRSLRGHRGGVGWVASPTPGSTMAVTIDQAGEDWNPDEQLCVVRPSPSSCLHLVSVAGDLEAPTSAGTAGLAKKRAASQGERHHGVHPTGSPEGTSKAQGQTQQPGSHGAHRPTGVLVTLPGQQLRHELPLPHTLGERAGPRIMPSSPAQWPTGVPKETPVPRKDISSLGELYHSRASQNVMSSGKSW